MLDSDPHPIKADPQHCFKNDCMRYFPEGGAKCQKLLLVEDMPSFALSKPTEFITILEMYARTHVKHPLGTLIVRTKFPHLAFCDDKKNNKLFFSYIRLFGLFGKKNCGRLLLFRL
jgi:hypothetical protein